MGLWRVKRKSNFFTCAKKPLLLACDEFFSASLRKDRRAPRSATTRTPGTGIPSGRRQLLIYFWHQALRCRHTAWLPGRLRRGRDHAGLQLARLPVRDEVDHESPAASQHHARHQYDGWIVWRVREKYGRRSSRATGYEGGARAWPPMRTNKRTPQTHTSLFSHAHAVPGSSITDSPQPCPAWP